MWNLRCWRDDDDDDNWRVVTTQWIRACSCRICLLHVAERENIFARGKYYRSVICAKTCTQSTIISSWNEHGRALWGSAEKDDDVSVGEKKEKRKKNISSGMKTFRKSCLSSLDDCSVTLLLSLLSYFFFVVNRNHSI